jgi:hypothetical protein
MGKALRESSRVGLLETIRLRPRGRPCRGHSRATLPADFNENWLLPTNVGPLLRYRTTHEQDKKYQHQADRSRKGEDVKVGQ